jgi:hypothetical protein
VPRIGQAPPLLDRPAATRRRNCGTAGTAGTPSKQRAGVSSNPITALQQIAAQQRHSIAESRRRQKLLPDFGQLAVPRRRHKETLLPPASDPTQWKTTKSIGALLGFIGGIPAIRPHPSWVVSVVLTGSGSGLYSGIMGAIPQPFGNLAPMPEPGTSISPGGFKATRSQHRQLPRHSGNSLSPAPKPKPRFTPAREKPT